MPASTDNEYDIDMNLAYGILGRRGLRWVLNFQLAGEDVIDAIVAATPKRVFRVGSTRLVFETKMVNDWNGGTRDSYVFKPAPLERRASPIIEVDTSIPAH